MRPAVTLVATLLATGCASAPSHYVPPGAEQSRHSCGGVQGPGELLNVTRFVVADAALGTGSAIEVFSCCRGVLFVDGEARLMLTDDDKAASIELPDGKYRLSVEAEGRLRYEVDVELPPGARLQMKVTQRSE